MIQPSSVNDSALVGTVDLMPTLLDLAGVKIPEGLDGRSFKREILQPNNDYSDFEMLFSQNQFGRMVRFEHFKYVRSQVYGKNYEILFDLRNDPQESKNLSIDPQYKDFLNRGRILLDEWMESEEIPLIAER